MLTKRIIPCLDVKDGRCGTRETPWRPEKPTPGWERTNWSSLI